MTIGFLSVLCASFPAAHVVITTVEIARVNASAPGAAVVATEREGENLQELVDGRDEGGEGDLEAQTGQGKW